MSVCSMRGLSDREVREKSYYIPSGIFKNFNYEDEVSVFRIYI